MFAALMGEIVREFESFDLNIFMNSLLFEVNKRRLIFFSGHNNIIKNNINPNTIVYENNTNYGRICLNNINSFPILNINNKIRGEIPKVLK